MQEKLSIPLNLEHSIHVQKGNQPKRCFLLLHGYLLDGKFIYNSLLETLGPDDLIIAPNGPFVIPVKKKEAYLPKYAWYFFDPAKKTYYINYEPAADYLVKIVNHYNKENLPLTVIGYSQGGYLSPKVAQLYPNTEKVIGLACVFRNKLFKLNSNTTYHQVHAINDIVVELKSAKPEWEELKERGNNGKFLEIQDSGHRIDENYLAQLKKLI